MCGILGVRRSWLPDRDAAARALRALAWRGPDGAELVDAGDWSLGVARLAITDPAAGQPLRCPHTGRWVVFNGAVTSAAREWGAVGDAAATRNDAELVLHRLRAQGPRGLTATCGPYALAVLDPAHDTLWLARDPEGEKPLFAVTRGAQVVAFASSVAALRALGLDVRLDGDNTARLLRYGFALAPVWAADGLRLHGDLRGAWVATPAGGLRAVPDALVPPEQNGGADFAQRVVDATARCATAAVPVGLSLSGGVDSACLAAALQRAGRAVPAYQFRARGAAGGERERARAVAAATGMPWRPVDGGPEVLQALGELTRCAGLPQGDPSVLASHALARAARADGVRVLLSGEGADDLWLGYRRHRAARWLPARGLRWLPAPPLAQGAGARLLRAWAAPAPYDALLQVAPPGFLAAVLRPGALGGGALPGSTGGAAALRRARDVDRAFYLRCDLLPKCDTATMAAGVEARCPYLDPALLGCAETAAPPRAVLGKRALRAAFRGAVPAAVLDGPKLGFGLPLDRWLREDDFLADVLREPRTRQRPHLRGEGLQRMLDRSRAGRRGLGHALYLIVAHELYLRTLEAAA